MDSPSVTRLFRRLLTQKFCEQARPSSRASAKVLRAQCQPARAASSYSELQRAARTSPQWHPRSLTPPPNVVAESSKYELVSSAQLARKGRRPKRANMLMRDFIEDSLYNPEYGYFSKQVVIFDPGEPFDFTELESDADFNRALDQRYTSFEDDLDVEAFNETRQLWHTPTELFRPYYAEAMARYMISNYKMSLFPYHDLIIYELGAGRGTFMLDVLSFIRDLEPEVYARTRYNIVEISASLAALQSQRLMGAAASEGHADKVDIINRSIFSWDELVSSPCFVVALEVIDNFAHDVVRYDLKTGQPRQGHVLIDTEGEMYETYSHRIDPLVARYLRIRNAMSTSTLKLPPHPGRLRQLRSRVSGEPLLTEREYIPTRLMQFFDILQKYFPLHRLLLSDFHTLPDAVAGVNGPVVQTRYRRRTVPVSTPLVRQGYFDIFFPTDFPQVEDMYRIITGRFTRLMSQGDFLRRWAVLGETTTVNGENPLLTWYANASVLTTV